MGEQKKTPLLKSRKVGVVLITLLAAISVTGCYLFTLPSEVKASKHIVRVNNIISEFKSLGIELEEAGEFYPNVRLKLIVIGHYNQESCNWSTVKVAIHNFVKEYCVDNGVRRVYFWEGYSNIIYIHALFKREGLTIQKTLAIYTTGD